MGGTPQTVSFQSNKGRDYLLSVHATAFFHAAQIPECGIISQSIALPLGEIAFMGAIREMGFTLKDFIFPFAAVVFVVNHKRFNKFRAKTPWSGIFIFDPSPHDIIRTAIYAFGRNGHFYLSGQLCCNCYPIGICRHIRDNRCIRGHAQF